MGWVTCIGSCYGCGRAFTFNPACVPSLTIDGERRPFCANCIEAANVRRKSSGLPPLVPRPQAYEAASEGDM